eukprot:TRINITY_DN453_c0_g1_i1.p1 TRINITY_DN453_c0_g1~~TRINITY_DN453_c0_g1_i1.p1  ORF type:complete len:311 (-),score=40.62 TRINITY_DN453_c0_g1_i1:1250-2182(-)
MLRMDIEDAVDAVEESSSPSNEVPPSVKPVEDEDCEINQTVMPNIGDNIEVFWLLDNTFYQGSAGNYDDNSGLYRVDYLHGEVKNLDLQNEQWKFSSTDCEQLSSNKGELLPGTELTSTDKEALKFYFDMFNTKEFLLYQAIGLPQFITQNAFATGEDNFKKIVREVHVSRVPANANIISSHVLYKVKIKDDNSLMMKARIAPHGNKDREKQLLKTDSAVCPPLDFRTLLSFVSLFRWTLVKIDVKSAFLQTGCAERDIYVVRPKESKNKSFYWLLLTAAYGLVNASAKWQDQSDSLATAVRSTLVLHEV